ncbi:hypothetical protein KPH14_001757 [Odynerus spinipes]|uniref:Small ribosomal subunit protein mS35 mitochondrial conserved domain-containing protein n=1 Tax=Odynerus spinipes TaxID=1348599 RepID=A0AAD9RZP0_9HYME|nr:hypothetical protein KPH14_001757 [Odynerus spinipes]
MSIFVRRCERNSVFSLLRVFNSTTASKQTNNENTKEEFRVLDLFPKKKTVEQHKKQQFPLPPPRCDKMPVDQDWPSVWPGPRTFHPAVVPLPIRQGYMKSGHAPPKKTANTELMKIPNFLHLTPPAVKRHCEALKQFCTEWPKELNTDQDCNKYFPVEIITSDYCYASPTIREPLARIVSLRLNLNSLTLDTHAKDKLLRLLGNRYNPETNMITITADRCPTKKQNLEYVEYLLTAVFHESWKVEAWEAEKSEADMEYYDWNKSKSRESLITLHTWPEPPTDIDIESIPAATEYKIAVSELINQGEDHYSLNKSCTIGREFHFIVHDRSSCKNLAVCYLIEMLSTSYKKKSDTSIPSVPKGYSKAETSLQARSYYNGFGAPATATYYPTFDPISVLASLAFLAFLLQSFASLFDRSRSILPTIVSSRESSPNLKTTGVTRRILNALDEYDNLNKGLVQDDQINTISL